MPSSFGSVTPLGIFGTPAAGAGTTPFPSAGNTLTANPATGGAAPGSGGETLTANPATGGAAPASVGGAPFAVAPVANQAPAAASASAAHYYEATLGPINNSGASGVAILAQEGNVLNVELEATGLTPNQTHMQHIHGFTNGQPSVAPTPTLDINHDGFVASTEAETVTGPELLDLTLNPQLAVQQHAGSESGGIYPTADANGVLHYQETFAFPSGAPAASVLQNLGNRAVELHGMNVPPGVDGMTSATYDPSMPVAFGLLHEITPSTFTFLSQALTNGNVG